MAEPEWQARVNRLDEVTAVQASLLDRLERKYDGAVQWHDEAIKRHAEAIKQHDQWIAELQAAQLKTEQSLQVLSSGLNALTETVDRFLRGQEGNGRKQ
jgi:prefoldin subunit 5